MRILVAFLIGAAMIITAATINRNTSTAAEEPARPLWPTEWHYLQNFRGISVLFFTDKWGRHCTYIDGHRSGALDCTDEDDGSKARDQEVR